MPALRIHYPNLGVITHVLRSECVTIGRAADNSIQIPHASISNHHAEIRAADGVFRLRDVGSTNHTFLNGERITEAELTPGCRIALGSIECEYDALATTTARLPEPVAALPAPQLAILENENRELRAHVTALQRRFDILGSARLTTMQMDRTPSAVASDTMRTLTSERDEIRQQAAGLRLEVGRLREELAVTARERDAARQAAAALQAERTQLQLELQQAGLRIERLRSELIIANEAATPPQPPPPPTPPPPRPPSVGPPLRSSSLPPRPPARALPALSTERTPAPASTPSAQVILTPPRPAPPEPRPADRFADATQLPAGVARLREVCAQLAVAPRDPALIAGALEAARSVLEFTPGRGPLRRLAIRADTLLTSLAEHEQTPGNAVLRTLRQSGELLERLLDPGLRQAADELPTAQVLAIDDDPDLLAALSAALATTDIEVSGCTTAEEAMIAIEALRFDTIIADIGLPGIKGPEFCAHARSRPAYRRTPILFLTGSDTLDKRAETSLNGGTEFIAKPFDCMDLALKVEMWTLKHQLHLA